MAPDSSTLAWEIPWMEEPGRLQSMGSLRVRYNWATSLSLSCIGEGNGNPLQCSCLENPGTGEPGGLLSMGLPRVRHDWSDLTEAAAAVTSNRVHWILSSLWLVEFKGNWYSNLFELYASSSYNCILYFLQISIFPSFPFFILYVRLDYLTANPVIFNYINV